MSIKIKNKKLSILRTIGLSLALSFFLASTNTVFAADGQTGETFLVDKTYDFYGRASTSAFLIYESDNAYFYFEREYYNTMTSQEKEGVNASVKKLGKDFDSVIYPKTKGVFGDEWSPGIDNNEKIVILFIRMNYGIGGYFNPNDEYPKKEVAEARSNEHEMIYLNIDYLNQPKAAGFLGHELQHMIYWNERTRVKGITDDIWINEGRSELAASMVESDLGKKFSDGTFSIRKKDFLLKYTDSIADWNNSVYDYASANVFMQYLRDQVGTGVFRQMNSTRKTGITNLNYILEREKGLGLTNVFTNWTIANYVNNTALDPRYGYRNENLSSDFDVKPTSISDKSGRGEINTTGSLKNWSTNYYKVDLSEKKYSNLYLEIDFNGEDSGVFSFSVVTNYKDGTKKVDILTMDNRQDARKEVVSTNGNISSIVFIPSSQKVDEAMSGNQVQSHPFSLDIRLTPTKDKVRSNGSLIRTIGGEKIYLVENGKKRWITDSTTFVAKGYDWGGVIDISAAEMEVYAEGANISGGDSSVQERTLVKGDGPKVYFIEGGRRRWVKDETTFNHYGFDWNKVVRVSDQELFKYSEGETLSKSIIAEGTLFKGAGPQVYLLQSGKKCWVVSPAAFSKNNFKWSSIVETSEDVVSSYADGPNLD